MPKTKRRQLIESLIGWMIETKNTERMDVGDITPTAAEFERHEKVTEAAKLPPRSGSGRGRG